MHPAGDEVVCCIQGHMTLRQEHADGSTASLVPATMRSIRPGPGTPPIRTSRWSPCS
jgi:hypothetical protein